VNYLDNPRAKRNYQTRRSAFSAALHHSSEGSTTDDENHHINDDTPEHMTQQMLFAGVRGDQDHQDLTAKAFNVTAPTDSIDTKPEDPESTTRIVHKEDDPGTTNRRGSYGKLCSDITLMLLAMLLIFNTTYVWLFLPFPTTMVHWFRQYCATPAVIIWVVRNSPDSIHTTARLYYQRLRLFIRDSISAIPRFHIQNHARWELITNMTAIFVIICLLILRTADAREISLVRSNTGDYYKTDPNSRLSALTARSSSTTFLICDSGCSKSLIADLSFFTKRTVLDKPVQVEGVNGMLTLRIVGDVEINFNDQNGLPCCVRLHNVFYNDSTSCNLLSVSDLNNAGWHVLFYVGNSYMENADTHSKVSLSKRGDGLFGLPIFFKWNKRSQTPPSDAHGDPPNDPKSRTFFQFTARTNASTNFSAPMLRGDLMHCRLHAPPNKIVESASYFKSMGCPKLTAKDFSRTPCRTCQIANARRQNRPPASRKKYPSEASLWCMDMYDMGLII